MDRRGFLKLNFSTFAAMLFPPVIANAITPTPIVLPEATPVFVPRKKSIPGVSIVTPDFTFSHWPLIDPITGVLGPIGYILQEWMDTPYKDLIATEDRIELDLRERAARLGRNKLPGRLEKWLRIPFPIIPEKYDPQQFIHDTDSVVGFTIRTMVVGASGELNTTPPAPRRIGASLQLFDGMPNVDRVYSNAFWQAGCEQLCKHIINKGQPKSNTNSPDPFFEKFLEGTLGDNTTLPKIELI